MASVRRLENQPTFAAAAWGHVCGQLGTRDHAAAGAVTCGAAVVLWQTDQRPETEQLALRTRESDHLWTGCPEESLLQVASYYLPTFRHIPSPGNAVHSEFYIIHLIHDNR